MDTINLIRKPGTRLFWHPVDGWVTPTAWTLSRFYYIAEAAEGIAQRVGGTPVDRAGAKAILGIG